MGCFQSKSSFCLYNINGMRGNFDGVTNKSLEECNLCGGSYVINIINFYYYFYIYYFILFFIVFRLYY